MVDDQEENAYLLHSLLRGHGHEVQTARNGAEALAAARRSPPDLVIADVLMPVVDGFTLCYLWRHDPGLKHIPFVFYTATYTEPSDEEFALSLGADRYIIKPTAPADFMAIVARVLDDYESGRLRARVDCLDPEMEYLRRHNAALMRKLEDKLFELQRANRTLAEKDAFNNAVINALTAPVAVVGAGGDVLATNQAWSGFARPPNSHGFLDLEPGDSVLEQGYGATALADDVARFRSAVREVLGGRMAHAQVELSLGGPEGRCFVLSCDRVGVAGAGAVIAAMDVSERKRGQTALEEAARRKDEFLALLGHELRNPLAPIKTSAQILKMLRMGDPRAERAREAIDRQASHLTRLVDDLLDVSRIARGRLVVRREPTDFAAVVRSTAEDLSSGFTSRGLEFRVTGADGPAWVNGDPTRLAQVVANVLGNAAKFTDRGGLVEARLDIEDGCVRLTVRDTGIGMSPETVGRLFQPFEQAPQSSARSRGGLGIGLALVQGLAQLHGGQVSASSPGLGHGSEFIVRLPLSDANAAQRPVPIAQSADGARVLVIEDNADAAATLRTLLEMSGCVVDVAADGESGLDRARSTRPEAIVCDIGLPGSMDGYAVARAIRNDPTLHSAHLVALTGYGQREDRVRATQAGFDAHVTKPADPQAVLSLVGAAHHTRARASHHA